MIKIYRWNCSFGDRGLGNGKRTNYEHRWHAKKHWADMMKIIDKVARLQSLSLARWARLFTPIIDFLLWKAFTEYSPEYIYIILEHETKKERNEQQQRHQQTTLVWFIGQDQNKERRKSLLFCLSFPSNLHPLIELRIHWHQSDYHRGSRTVSQSIFSLHLSEWRLMASRPWQHLELTRIPTRNPFLDLSNVAMTSKMKYNINL